MHSLAKRAPLGREPNNDICETTLSQAIQATFRIEARCSSSGREASALGERLILGICFGSVGLESRIRHLPIGLLARPDRIDLSSSPPLRYVDIIDASAIETEDLLLERRRKLRVAVRFNQRRCNLKAAEGLDLVLR
jgi:hypothetical protein